VEIKTEADSNDITECPHDDKTKPGRFVFFLILMYLHMFFVLKNSSDMIS